MKKLLIFIFLYLSFTSLSAQTWKPVKIDSMVSVMLPAGYSESDTLGQHILSVKSLFGSMQIVVTPDNPAKTPDIDKEKHLKRFYEDYINKIRSTSKGTILDAKDTLLGKLRVKDFTLEVDSSSGKQLRNFRILHENCATYTFQFLYQDIHKDISAEERGRFFSSIKVANSPILQSQFTSETAVPGSSKKTYLIAGGGILIVLIILIVWIRRRIKN